MPSQKEHNFFKHSLKEGARIDMYRGLASDDLVNAERNGGWEYYYNRLYMYKTRIHDNFSAFTTNIVANAMEMAAGLSYTAFADGTNLRTGEEFLVEFPSDESKMAWKKV